MLGRNTNLWPWILLALSAAPGCHSVPAARVDPQTASQPVTSEVPSEFATQAAAHAPPGQAERVNVQLVSLVSPPLEGQDDPTTLPSPEFVMREPSHEGLALEDVIAVTLSSNPDLDSASQQIAIASATLARARAEFYPKLGISEQYGVTNNPVRAFMFQLNQGLFSPAGDVNRPGTKNDFQTQLLLEHNIYSGHRRLHQMHAAAAEQSGSVHNLAALQNQLVFDAAEAYYRLLQANALLTVREEAVQQVEQHLKIVESRYRNETAVKSDVLSVEVRLAEVREALITARNSRELAWAIIENVVGSPLARRPLPEHVASSPWAEEIDQIESAVAEAQSLRPEVSAIASRRQAATEEVLVAEAGKKPTADALASYDVYTPDFGRGNDSYFLGLIVQLNLFDGGRTCRDVEKAMARVRELRAREQRLLLNIELDVRQTQLNLLDARERLGVATQAIGQAGESLREIEVRYRSQAATITELIDSQVALSNARVRRANAEADVEIARASLYRAIGRLTDSLAL